MEHTIKKRTQLRKKLFTIPHMNLVLLLVLIIFTVYTMFAPIIPAKYSRPIVQDPNNVVAGKTLSYKMNSCRYVGEGVVTTITRKLVSTTDPSLLPITLTADVVTNPSRCVDVKRTVIVPFGSPAGEYQLVITGVYQVVPLRQPITVQAKSDSFKLREATQEDIDRYNAIQAGPITEEPSVGGSSSTDPKAVGNSGGSPAISQSKSSSTPNVTNNTTNTTNNITNNTTQGTDSKKEPGLVQRILNNLPLGL